MYPEFLKLEQKSEISHKNSETTDNAKYMTVGMVNSYETHVFFYKFYVLQWLVILVFV